MYIRNVHLTTSELCIPGYKESYCVLEYNITCVAVNFYWSELDTLSGQIYCTLDIFGYCTVI